MSDFFSHADTGARPPRPSIVSSSDDQTQAIGPPTVVLCVLTVELVLTAICFAPSTRAFHIVGYFVGAVVIALTAVSYRSIDRKRRRSRAYVIQPSHGFIVVGMLVVAIGLAVWHAYYVAQTQVLAK